MRIPRVGPGSGQLTTITPNAKQTVADQTGTGLEAIGGAVNDSMNYAYKQLEEARNYSEVAQAKLKMTQGMADLMLKADTDIDPATGKLRTGKKEDYASYDQALSTMRQEVSKGFTNKETQERFLSGEYDLAALTTKNKIQNTFTKNMIDEGKTATLQLVDSSIGAYGVTKDAASLKQIEMDIDAAANRGFFTSQEAYKLKQEKIGSAIEQAIYNDNSTEEKDSVILAKLQDGKNPIYAGLSNEERLNLIKKSQQRVFQNNQTFKRAVEVSQNQRNDAFIDKLASGTANFRDVDAEFAIPESQGGMKRSVLDQYQRRLQAGVKDDLNIMIREKDASKDPTTRAKKVKEYNDLIDMFIEDTGDQWKAKEALAKGYADGNLDAGELKILTPLKNNLKDIEFNRNTSPLAKALKQVKTWMKSSNATDEEIALRTKQLLGGVGAGEKPQDMAKKIMDSEMLKHFPDYTSYPKEGKLKQDSSGRQYKVFPDGNWAWVIGKKAESK